MNEKTFLHIHKLIIVKKIFYITLKVEINNSLSNTPQGANVYLLECGLIPKKR